MTAGATAMIGLARRIGGYIGFLAVAAVLWQALVALFGVPPFIMPTPGATWAALIGAHATILDHLGFTLKGAVLGLAISTAVALGLAALFALSARTAAATMPIVIVLRTIPVVAVAPLMIMLVGRTLWTSVVVVVIVSFFPILVNGLRGFTSASTESCELMHVVGARWWQTLLKVRLPNALPFIFTGLRIASSAAILGAMLAEWLSGAPGLGFLILDSAAMQNTAELWAVTLVSMTTGFLVFALTVTAERVLLAWRE
jgi:ABC-type nitrate/sulfonate/bicarbonate transport system permease component